MIPKAELGELYAALLADVRTLYQARATGPAPPRLRTVPNRSAHRPALCSAHRSAYRCAYTLRSSELRNSGPKNWSADGCEQVCKLVHADLSEYNILYHERKLFIIDVSQARQPRVSPASAPHRPRVSPVSAHPAHFTARAAFVVLRPACPIACVAAPPHRSEAAPRGVRVSQALGPL